MGLILKDRDFDLFKGLYQLRILSAAQIKRAYYNNLNYAYKKIKELERQGFLESRPFVEGTVKKTQYYYLTQKGVDALCIQNARRADKNQLTEKILVERQLIINEIPTTVTQLEKQKETAIWRWQDSREAKQAYGFNLKDLIAGVLVNKRTGAKYGIYVPTIVKDNKQDEEIKKNIHGLITQIHDEIDRHAFVPDNIIICHSSTLLTEFRNRMKPVGRSLKILVINYGINYIYNFLSDYHAALIKLYSEALSILPGDIKKSGELFATHEKRDMYLAEFMTFDIVLMRYVYDYVLKSKNTRPIAILCWDRQKKQVERFFREFRNNNRVILQTVSWDSSELKEGADALPRLRKNILPPKVRMRFSLNRIAANYLDKMDIDKRSKYIESLIIKDMNLHAAELQL